MNSGKNKGKVESKESEKVKVEKSKEIRLNIDYVNFICELMKSKIENKEYIEEKYNEVVGLRFSNINRVNGRVNRKGFEESIKKMCEEKGIEYVDFRVKCLDVVDLEKEKGNYLSIKI